MQTICNKFLAELGEEKSERLIERLHEVNSHIVNRGIVPCGPSSRLPDLLTGYSYGEFYDWDLYFENIYMSYYGVHRFCRSNVIAFLDRQLECGFVARSLVYQRLRQHFKPFLAQITLLGCRQRGQYDWLREKVYDKLKKYLDYWFWYCDYDKNGLAVWDSADHSGMDNQCSRAGVPNARNIEGVDLNSYLVRELYAMEQIALELGLDADAKGFKEHAVKLSQLINDVFWDEKDGFYYDRHERTGELVKVKSVAGFIPFWAGIVPKDRAERLINEHLLNEKEFKTNYPIPAYSISEPDYYQERQKTECNWRGTTWIPTNYMVFQGLRKSGYDNLAKKLAYSTFEMVLNEETTREYYNAENGCGFGMNPFWGWSILGYYMPLEYELNYDPTEITNKNILRPGKEGLNIQIKLYK